MLNLFISVFFSICIANLLKLYQKHSNVNFLNIFIGNYFIASIFSIIQNKLSFTLILHWDIILAIFNGVLFLLSFYVFQKNIKVNGISLSVSIMRIALIIPTLLSVIVFNELINSYKYYVIGILLISILFLSKHDKQINPLWLFLLFILSGIIDFSMKIFDIYGINSSSMFLFILFLSALITNLLTIIFKKIRFSTRDFINGLILGVPNQLTSLYLLKALSQIPGTIVYPVHASSIIVFSILSDLIIWKERLPLKKLVLFSIIVLCIIILNIKV